MECLATKTQNNHSEEQAAARNVVDSMDTFMVGVCAILFCMNVDDVLDKMPAVVWAFTV